MEYIHLLNAYIDETDYTVWADIMSNLKQLSALFERTKLCAEFKSFVLALITPVAERLGCEKKENEGFHCLYCFVVLLVYFVFACVRVCVFRVCVRACVRA